MPSTDTAINKTAVYWHFAGMLPTVRGLDRAQIKAIGQEASNACTENPLHMITKPVFSIPSYSMEKLTGPSVIALMIACVWVLCGEDENIAAAMLSDWSDIPMYAKLANS